MSSDTNHVLLTMHMCGFGLSGFRCLSSAFFLANPLKSVGVGERVVGVGSAEWVGQRFGPSTAISPLWTHLAKTTNALPCELFRKSKFR